MGHHLILLLFSNVAERDAMLELSALILWKHIYKFGTEIMLINSEMHTPKKRHKKTFSDKFPESKH